jgi:hypothetical protein
MWIPRFYSSSRYGMSYLYEACYVRACEVVVEAVAKDEEPS